MKNKNILKSLYGSNDYQRGLSDGLERGRLEKIPKPIIIKKIITKTILRKDHPHSRWLKWGIVSKGILLYRTFTTRDEAETFIKVGLQPMNPNLKIKTDAVVVNLNN